MANISNLTNMGETSSLASILRERRFYLSVLQTLGILILAAMLAVILYGGVKIANDDKSVGGNVQNVGTQAQQIDTSSKSNAQHS